MRSKRFSRFIQFRFWYQVKGFAVGAPRPFAASGFVNAKKALAGGAFKFDRHPINLCHRLKIVNRNCNGTTYCLHNFTCGDQNRLIVQTQLTEPRHGRRYRPFPSGYLKPGMSRPSVQGTPASFNFFSKALKSELINFLIVFETTLNSVRAIST